MGECRRAGQRELVPAQAVAAQLAQCSHGDLGRLGLELAPHAGRVLAQPGRLAAQPGDQRSALAPKRRPEMDSSAHSDAVRTPRSSCFRSSISRPASAGSWARPTAMAASRRSGPSSSSRIRRTGARTSGSIGFGTMAARLPIAGRSTASSPARPSRSRARAGSASGSRLWLQPSTSADPISSGAFGIQKLTNATPRASRPRMPATAFCSALSRPCGAASTVRRTSTRSSLVPMRALTSSSA
jgi:hypothetical protein